MSEFLCHKCANESGRINFASEWEITGNKKQQEKFGKHTTDPIGTAGITSQWLDPRPETYSANIASALAFGFVEIDYRNNLNYLLVMDRPVGITYSNGRMSAVADAIKVVGYGTGIHSYPTASTDIRRALCRSCNASLAP